MFAKRWLKEMIPSLKKTGMDDGLAFSFMFYLLLLLSRVAHAVNPSTYLLFTYRAFPFKQEAYYFLLVASKCYLSELPFCVFASPVVSRWFFTFESSSWKNNKHIINRDCEHYFIWTIPCVLACVVLGECGENVITIWKQVDSQVDCICAWMYFGFISISTMERNEEKEEKLNNDKFYRCVVHVRVVSALE